MAAAHSCVGREALGPVCGRGVQGHRALALEGAALVLAWGAAMVVATMHSCSNVAMTSMAAVRSCLGHEALVLDVTPSLSDALHWVWEHGDLGLCEFYFRWVSLSL